MQCKFCQKKCYFCRKRQKIEILDKIRGSDHCPMGGIPQCADFLRFYVVTNGITQQNIVAGNTLK